MKEVRQVMFGLVRSNWFVLAAALLAATLLMLALGYTVLDYYLSHAEGLGGVDAPQDPAKLGTLGDFFGGLLNPVFGFLSVVGLLVAVVLQREQLQQVKREAQASARAAETQAFENTFFQLLRLHQEILNSVELSDHEGLFRGRAAIHRLYGESFSDYDLLERCQNWDEREEFLAWLNDYYEDNYIRFGHLVEHYYQSIENIASFVHRSAIRNKAFYARLLRGQFSQYELLMMFFHALRDEAFGLKESIEELSLFEGLRPQNLPDYSLLALYEVRAYGIGLVKWSALRSDAASQLSAANIQRALKAASEMMESCQERLLSVRARKFDLAGAGQDHENESDEIARLEVEVGRLSRLHKALSKRRAEPEV
ncbi:putative phage abortive infection protein [Uliginosibacterium sp. TH139]|uniref:putative phage abortive infection protein n=1 Tax=Uliginosibacterium sp. TH139 TaxID=2067453 RepID=UPI000C79754B|nr:putative phage abortive infection protein [Uliginosibacterium sp. TH139]PLK49667.1 hypothetical protein C0V76_04345 [Uliginosibacterium sp. TH139]